MSSRYGGTSAFDRYRERLAGRSHSCKGCGFVEETGAWEAATSGAAVEYRRECPSCGTEHVQRYWL